MKGLDEKLKAMRDARGWTQPVAAEHMGVEKQTISNIERGKTKQPKPSTLLAISRVFGVPISELMDETNDDPARAEALAAISAILGRMDIETLVASRDILQIVARFRRR